MTIPKEDGFYWAMWLVSDDDTPKEYDGTPHRIWDVVELFTNDDGHCRVYIAGVPGSQAADGFHWHPERLQPPLLKWLAHTIRTESVMARYRKMTPEQREEFYQEQLRAQHKVST